jgi:hypothetical protein
VALDVEAHNNRAYASSPPGMWQHLGARRPTDGQQLVVEKCSHPGKRRPGGVSESRRQRRLAMRHLIG